MRCMGLILATALLAACSQASAPSIDHSGDMESRVVSLADITADKADWGTFYPHFTQQTFGTNPTLTGVAHIDAGQQIHPPHRHSDEEFLMVTKGRGTWHLNGEDFPAKEGDILYAKPWDYHGVKAADDSPLHFVVFKWSNKGIPNPDPDPSLPEELSD